MKILVISDTHRSQLYFYELLEKIKDIDYVIHCGDVEGCDDEMESICRVPFVAVAGNNDFCSYLPRERVLELMGHRIFVTHGHMFNVSAGIGRIMEEAESRDCDVVLFGHTHRPTYSDNGRVLAMNPGSISLPRQASKRPSYAILELKEGEKANCQLCEIED